MNSDFVELGLEAFDHLTDRYYDHVHTAAEKVGPWLRQQRARSSSRSRTKHPKEKQESMPTSPAQDYPPPSRGSRRDRYDENDYGESRGRRSASRKRIVERDSPDRDDGSPRNNRDVRDSRTPKIRIASASIPRSSDSHIYPPAPQPMHPPYPTTAGALLPMPPDAPYPPLSRSASERGRGHTQALDVVRPRLGRARSTGYYDDDYWDHPNGRDKRNRSSSRDRRPHSHKQERDLHLGASLAGAVAGGFLGKKASKGDWKATVAGVVVGALGANVAEREWERRQRKDEKQEEDWEKKWGRRR